MKSRRLLLMFITTALAGAVVMNSCTKKDAKAVSVSFSKDIIPILTANCALNSDCHVGSYNLNDHIDLTDSMAYHTITTAGIISYSTPSQSLLYAEISTGVMPKAPYNKLTDVQINLILNWIEQGAKDN